MAAGRQQRGENMFREMRRTRQILSREACLEIMERGSAGVLAVAGDDEYPYTVPLSYVYTDAGICFHSAVTGHKIDAIARNNKVSFCVTDQDLVKPEEFTTYFRSVVCFGKIQILEDPEEKTKALVALADKYSPGVAKRDTEIERLLAHTCVLLMTIDHMSGKEAIELVK